MKEKFFVIFVLALILHCPVDAKAQERDSTSLSVFTTFDFSKNILEDFSHQAFEKNINLFWKLDYEAYKPLREKGFYISIRYKNKGDSLPDSWQNIQKIDLREKAFTVENLQEGQSYILQWGLSNEHQDYWLETIELITRKKWGWFDALMMVGSLGLFIYGMKTMSDGLQRAAGNRLRHFLSSITSNQFRGVFAGIGITAFVQSSTVTSVMAVSFVNAGLLTLTESVGVIMGANIGTTLTGWIVNYLGFEIDLGVYSIIFIAFATFLMFSSNSTSKAWGNVIIGFSLLFLGLTFLIDSVPDIGEDAAIVQFFLRINDVGFLSTVLFVVFGIILTIILQSSSAALALIMTLVMGGIIPFNIATAIVLGGNVGTTVTAEIAAVVGNVYAKRAARINTLYNLIGVSVAIVLFPFLLGGVEYLMHKMGMGSPIDDPLVYGNTGIVIFHTGFNILNASVFVWFIPQLIKLSEKSVKSRGEEDEDFQLDYIGSGHTTTPSLSLLEVKKEIVKFGEVTHRMSKMAKLLLFEKNSKKQVELIQNIAYYEEVTDRMEVEVANYLNKISEGDTTSEITARIRGMNRIVSDLERIGDVFYQISKDLERKAEEKIWFTPVQREHLTEMFALLDDCFVVMLNNLEKHVAKVTLDKAIFADRNLSHKADVIEREHYDSLFNDDELNMRGVVIYNNVYDALKRVGEYVFKVSKSLKLSV